MSDSPNIPTLSSKVDPEVKKAFTSLKSWFEKVGGVVSPSDLTATGLFNRGPNGTLTPNAPFLDMTIPPQITGLAVSGSFAAIMLTWDDPRYRNLAYVEVYRATVNDLGQAVRVGTTQSTMYADRPPQSSLSVTYYYWVRIISVANVTGPYNSTSGTPGSTANDPTYVLEVLTNQIKEGQLYGDLASRIDLIDAPGTGLVDAVDVIADMQINQIPLQYNELFLDLMREKNISDATVYIDPVTGEISLLATANVTTEVEARITDLEFNMDAEAGKISILNQIAVFDRVSVTDFNTTVEVLNDAISLKTTTSYVDTAMLNIADTLTPAASDSITGDGPFAIMNLLLMGNKMNLESLAHKANIAQAQFDLQSNADAISAEATARLLLAAQVVDGDNVNAAAILVEQNARADADTAEAEAREILATRVQTAESAITQINTVTSTSTSASAQALASLQTAIADPTTGLASKASVVGLQTANSTLLSSVAQALMQTSTTLNGNTTTVETMAQSLDGVNGEYAIKIDANGAVAGIGLVNGPNGSEFGVLADRFWVMYPDAPEHSAAATYKKNARVSYGTKTVNEQEVPKQWRAIVDITAPEAWNPAHWDDANLSPFIVDSEYGVIFDTAYFKEATITSAMVEDLSADKLTVPGTGTIWEAIINLGKITNAYIGDFIQSTIYTPGSVGWKIDKTGAVEFNGGVFRGKVVFGAESSGYGNLTDKPTSLADISTDDGAVLTSTANFVSATYPDDQIAIQAQIDGKIETWYQDADPSPAWTTAALKLQHNGDFWYTVTAPRVLKRYSNSPAGWITITDDSVVEAVSAAQQTANSKRTVFTAQPVTPYIVGDLWAAGPLGDIKKCKTARATGVFNAADWELAAKYTDDSTVNAFVSGTYANDLESLQGQVDSKVESWSQDEDPSTAWTTAELKTAHTGDSWYSPTAKELKRWSGTVWGLIDNATAIAAAQAASGAQSTADSKRTVFTAQPVTPYLQGDLWLTSLVTGTGDIKKCITAKASGAYVAADWVKAAEYTKGAKAGTDLVDSAGTPLTDALVITSQGTAADTSAVNGVAATTVQTGAAAGAAAASTVAGWTRPGETTIDGNKISTADAYVDTLQIKGQAVTFPVAASVATDYETGTVSGTWYGVGVSVTVDASAGVFPVCITAHLYGSVQASYSGVGAGVAVGYVRVERSTDNVTWAQVGGSPIVPFADAYVSYYGGDTSAVTPACIICKDTPSAAGTIYYRIAVKVDSTGGTTRSCTVKARGLLAIGAKR